MNSTENSTAEQPAITSCPQAQDPFVFVSTLGSFLYKNKLKLSSLDMRNYERARVSTRYVFVLLPVPACHHFGSTGGGAWPSESSCSRGRREVGAPLQTTTAGHHGRRGQSPAGLGPHVRIHHVPQLVFHDRCSADHFKCSKNQFNPNSTLSSSYFEVLYSSIAKMLASSGLQLNY